MSAQHTDMVEHPTIAVYELPVVIDLDISPLPLCCILYFGWCDTNHVLCTVHHRCHYITPTLIKLVLELQQNRTCVY